MGNLLWSILLTSTWMVSFRYLKIFKINTFQAVTINYWICVGTGVLTFGNTTQLMATEIAIPWVKYAFILGGLFILTFYLMAIGAQTIGVTVTTVASKISLVIPVLFSLLILQSSHKQFNLVNYSGVLITLVAIVLTSVKQGDKVSLKTNVRSLLFPFLIFSLSATIDILLTFVNWKYSSHEDSATFSTLAFLAAAVAGMCVLLYQVLFLHQKLYWKSIPGGFVLGIPNFFSLYFLLEALQDFDSDAALLYPLFNIGVMFTSSLASVILFKEQLSWLNKGGIVLAIAAMVLIAYQEIIQYIG